jgi:hypothetical protein
MKKMKNTIRVEEVFIEEIQEDGNHESNFR